VTSDPRPSAAAAGRFVADPLDLIVSQCATCLHLAGLGPGPACCTAFPGGIPRPILDDEADHRLPYPGDHGVRWELVPGVIVPGSAGDLDA
jgi:hypothetical protein